jgi:hypothetical protein
MQAERYLKDLDILITRQLGHHEPLPDGDQRRWQRKASDTASRARAIARADPRQVAGAVLRAHQATTSAVPEVAIQPLFHALSAGPLMRHAADGRIEWTPTLSDASPALERVLAAAAKTRLPALERLRYAVDATDPYSRQDLLAAGPLTDRARHVPAQLWWSWRALLAPRRHTNDTQPATALSQLLCLIGRLGTVADAARALNGGANHQPAQLEVATRCRLSASTQEALILLARHLDETSAPIDYARRRERFSNRDILSSEHWRALCEGSGRPHNVAALVSANHFVRELLTGTHAETTTSTHEERTAYQRFRRWLSPTIVHALHDHAAKQLADAGIDEPITWSPPLALLRDLNIPQGPDRDRRRPGSTSAFEPVARKRSPKRVDRPRRKPTPPPPQRRKLDVEAVRAAYIEQRKPLRLIAQQFGCSREVVSRVLRDEAGITLRKTTPRFDIDERWFCDRYFLDLLTTEQIADLIGCSQSSVERFARNRGITLRARGSSSALMAARERSTFDGPDILKAAMTDSHASQRLERFQLAAKASTLGAAAARAGIDPITLTVQIRRLEDAIGSRLLERAQRGRPMRLTATGRELLTALELFRDGRAA